MLPVEQNVFVTRNVDALKVYYSKECYSLVQLQVERTVDVLINLCITTGEYPMVRYYSPLNPINDSAALPKLIATQFQERIDNYARANNNFPPPDQQRPRSIFVISDRTVDLFAPVLHEFTYQAMCFDLINFDKNKDGEYDNSYTYEAENEKREIETKTTVLNDLDPDWVSLRELHILDASETLVGKVNDLIVKNPLMVDRSNASTSTDLLYIVAHLKDFDEERRRITAHKKLIDSLLKLSGERGLPEAADFEQDCAAGGINFENEKVKGMAGILLTLLSQEIYTEGDKIRLILIYAIYRGGIIELDLIKLLHFSKLIELKGMILALMKNFEAVGFPLIKPNLKTKSFKKTAFHQIDNDGSFNTSRFKPAMKDIIEKAVNNTLDETIFPYIKDKPLNHEELELGFSNDINGSSLKNPRHKATWAKTRQVAYVPPRQRIFYFIAGGATYSEVRTAYELSASLSKDVIIGGDELITPGKFVESMISLNADRQSLNLYVDRKAAFDNRKAPSSLLKVQVNSAGKMSSAPQQRIVEKAPTPKPLEPKAKETTPEPKPKEKKRHKLTKFLR